MTTTIVLMDEETYWIYHLQLGMEPPIVTCKLAHQDGRHIPQLHTLQLELGPLIDGRSRRSRCRMKIGDRPVDARIINILCQPEPQA